jgi:hypothetical protein
VNKLSQNEKFSMLYIIILFLGASYLFYVGITKVELETIFFALGLFCMLIYQSLFVAYVRTKLTIIKNTDILKQVFKWSGVSFVILSILIQIL